MSAIREKELRHTQERLIAALERLAVLTEMLSHIGNVACGFAWAAGQKHQEELRAAWSQGFSVGANVNAPVVNPYR